jgi:hypothetical protein
MKALSCQDLHKHDFFTVIKITFLIFHHYRIIFLEKQLYNLIELEILYHPVYLLTILHLCAAAYKCKARQKYIAW